MPPSPGVRSRVKLGRDRPQVRCGSRSSGPDSQVNLTRPRVRVVRGSRTGGTWVTYGWYAGHVRVVCGSRTGGTRAEEGRYAAPTPVEVAVHRQPGLAAGVGREAAPNGTAVALGNPARVWPVSPGRVKGLRHPPHKPRSRPKNRGSAIPVIAPSTLNCSAAGVGRLARRRLS